MSMTESQVEEVMSSQEIEDTDLTTLALTHGAEQYGSSDYETLANIEAELESMHAEEVVTTESEEQSAVEPSVESILPDIEMAEVEKEPPTKQIIYTTASSLANPNTPSLFLQTKPTLQRVSPVSTASTTTTIPIKPNIGQTNQQSQSIMIVTPAVGGGGSQILKISHPASASPSQLQSIAQSLIQGKSTDGSIIQIRPPGTKTNIVAKTSGNIATGHSQSVKTVQSGKRNQQNVQQNKNVYTTKMYVTNTQPQNAQQLLIASSPTDSQQGETLKFLSSNSNLNVQNSPTKTITLAQAQQMGLLPAGKVQQILPSTQKQTGILVNKLVQSTTAQPAKFIISNSTTKSPAKILPAPSTSGHSKLSFNKTLQQNSQKVIIKQNSLKQGVVPNSNSIIRIPANQALNSNQVYQLQVPGEQVQYVRLVSTPTTGTSNVVTVGKTKITAAVPTISHKASGQQPQQIVKVVPLNTSSNQTTLRTVAPKTSVSNTTQRILIPATTSVGTGSSKTTLTLPASALSQIATGQAVISTNANVGNIVVLPAQYLQQTEEVKTKPQSNTPTLLNTSHGSQSSILANSSTISLSDSKPSKLLNNSDANGGIRPRKPCNCTKSQCLKLYCDCFANGEFCHMCNCNNCSNNLGNEEERQRAIKSCLERNPNAFRPKIGKGRDTGEDIRRHNKGCNCKRSGCLKNYCECYEAKIPCSENCKCIGCRNVEEPAVHKKSLKDLAEAAEVRTAQLTSFNKTKLLQIPDTTFRPAAASNAGARQPFNFLTDKVVEMTCQCLMAQAEEAERNMCDDEVSQKLIIEEFGRCLKEIIESAHKAEAT
ncbi:protein lin-54 homolog [Copidosoma floridanum]|uniref:protein lin-54 homolog n=1 Tax=Copidosoma floridanum TaxID=29053 RepID=UPI0006C9D864|nr:protein lin-54 homolog [Copidosoma floridanum]XP_014206997.1 protein lin-54 homolog [Copidosoma floridanum]XP_014206999.1 protein lin-54 homolog [Copidosoma floridanum]